MATVKVKSFLPYDISSVANYKAMCQGVGSAMSALGWVRADSVETDTGEVNWSNVVSSIPISAPSATFNWRAAWAGTSTNPTGYAAGDIVTSAGLTYQCAVATQMAFTNAVQNTAVTISTVASVAASTSVGNATYTGTGMGTTNQYVGYIFLITGFFNGNNNGTFICVGSTSTTLVLSNSKATAETPASAATAASSASNIGFYNASSTFARAMGNGMVGHSVTASGWVASAGLDNTTFTVTASGYINNAMGAVGGVFSGVNDSGGGKLTENTAPASDVGVGAANAAAYFSWIPYNYEIWKSAGPCSAAHPIYVKFLYSMSGTTSSPQIYVWTSTGQTNGLPTGSVANANGLSYVYAHKNSFVGTGTTLYECNFCGNADRFTMNLFKSSTASFSGLFCIDRSHDTNGGDVDAYAVLLSAVSGTAVYQVIFKPSVAGLYPAAGLATFPIINDAPNTSCAVNGSVAPLLIFPMIGYMANPCLGVIMFHLSDCSENTPVNVFMYGTVHTFLVSKNVLGLAGYAYAIEWENF